MKLYFLSIVLVLSLTLTETSPITAATTAVQSVPTSGYIVYNEHIYRYKTDFEDVTPVYPKALTIEPQHLVNTQPIPWSSNPDDWLRAAWYDVVTDRAYSGNKSLYFRLSDVRINRRIQLNIRSYGLYNKTLYFSAMYYLPSDWSIGGNLGWYNFWQIFPENYTQGYRVEFVIWNFGNKWSWNCRRQADNALMWSKTVPTSEVPIPLGQWFKVSIYIERDLTNGVAKLWLNDALLFNEQNVLTMSPAGEVFVSSLSIYHDETDYNTHEIWMDDLVIHDSMPEP